MPVVARYRDLGASVVKSSVITLRERPGVLVYVAPSSSAVEALRDAQERLLRRHSGRAKRAATHELGALLGYPRCCVSAFVERNHGGARGWLRAVPRACDRARHLRRRARSVGAAPAPARQSAAHARAAHVHQLRPVPLRLPGRDRAGRAHRRRGRQRRPEWVEFVDAELARPDRRGADRSARALSSKQATLAGGSAPPARRGTRGAGRSRETSASRPSSKAGRSAARGLVRGAQGFSPPVVIDFSARGAARDVSPESAC